MATQMQLEPLPAQAPAGPVSCQHCHASWRPPPRRRPTTSQVLTAASFFVQPVIADAVRVAAAAWCLRLLAESGALQLLGRLLWVAAGCAAWLCAAAVYLPLAALQLLCLGARLMEELLQAALCCASPLFLRDPLFPAVVLPLLALATAAALVLRAALVDAHSVRYLATSRRPQWEAARDFRYLLPHYCPGPDS